VAAANRVAEMTFWYRLIAVAAIFVVVSLLAQGVDRLLTRRSLPPEVVTRYRVFRRGVTVSILVVGLLSALLVIPEVRAVAGGLLASSALLAIIVGFASQRTLGNFVAGLLIAIAQPVRIGDRVEYAGAEGVVEEIGLTYTFIRTPDLARIVVPNEKLASDTIRNASIRNRETFAEITVPVPLAADLGAVVEGLREELVTDRSGRVLVTALDGDAVVTVRVAAATEDAAEELETELRLRAHHRLRALGVWG
jgi:small-conductance mechanosensitive channel